MMGFVLVRIPDGAYVARSGSIHSYTRKLEQAQVFKSRENANQNRCVNETIQSLEELLGG